MATGIIFEESMSEYRCLYDETYVEKPARFTRVLERIKELDLLERCVKLEPRKATEDELRMGHSQKLIDFMKSTTEVTEPEALKKLSAK